MDGTDEISFEKRQYMHDGVSLILNALNEAQVKYSIWGAAACEFHGARWLWKCQDYEILIEDWFEGPVMQRAVSTIMARCLQSWEYDHKFDQDMWTRSRGDRSPRRPVRRFRHIPDWSGQFSETEFGILLVPSANTSVMSMHHDDLVNEESDPVWIYPSLKNFVESQLKLWSLDGRNSALLELADLAQARRLTQEWATEVGLEISTVRRPGQSHLPSEKEIWDEVAKGALTKPNPHHATARFQARKAEKEAVRLAEMQEQMEVEATEDTSGGAVEAAVE